MRRPPTAVTISGWQDVFPDPKLRAVIDQALANSRDLRVAVAQIEAARAQYRVQRADLFPTVAASAGAAYGRVNENFGGTNALLRRTSVYGKRRVHLV